MPRALLPPPLPEPLLKAYLRLPNSAYRMVKFSSPRTACQQQSQVTNSRRFWVDAASIWWQRAVSHHPDISTACCSRLVWTLFKGRSTFSHTVSSTSSSAPSRKQDGKQASGKASQRVCTECGKDWGFQTNQDLSTLDSCNFPVRTGLFISLLLFFIFNVFILHLLVYFIFLFIFKSFYLCACFFCIT